MNALTSTPEYLHVFGEEGPVTVRVEGPNGTLPLPVRQVCAEDIAWLVSADGQLLRKQMSFDGSLHTIEHCVLCPQQQTITLHVC